MRPHRPLYISLINPVFPRRIITDRPSFSEEELALPLRPPILPSRAIYYVGNQTQLKPPGIELSVISTLSVKYAVFHIVLQGLQQIAIFMGHDKENPTLCSHFLLSDVWGGGGGGGKKCNVSPAETCLYVRVRLAHVLRFPCFVSYNVPHESIWEGRCLICHVKSLWPTLLANVHKLNLVSISAKQIIIHP